MLSSFRLPDLVLGVSIRADTTGARQAAQQLRASVQREMGLISGGARGNVGTVLGIAAGAGIAKGIQNQIPKVADNMAKQLSAAVATTLAMGHAYKGVQRYFPNTGPQGYGGIPIPPAINARNMAAGAKAAAPAVAGAVAGATASGAGKGFIAAIRQFKSIWTLIIGVLIIGTFKEALKTMLPALEYIRATGAGGKYGAFSENVSRVEVLLRNIGVQFGLMVINLLDLDKVLAALIPILIQIGSLFAWIGEQQWIKGLVKFGVNMNGNVAAMKLMAMLLAKLPQGKGGVDLGQGLPGAKMAGASLEGSVEAYRTIQGTMMKYAAETAKNTKEAAGALKKILERAPEMGVVAG